MALPEEENEEESEQKSRRPYYRRKYTTKKIRDLTNLRRETSLSLQKAAPAEPVAASVPEIPPIVQEVESILTEPQAAAAPLPPAVEPEPAPKTEYALEPVIAPVLEAEPPPLIVAGPSRRARLRTLDVGVSFAAGVLLFMMLDLALRTGWADYTAFEPGPYIFLMALLTAWFQRNHLQRRSEWSSTALIVGAAGLVGHTVASYFHASYIWQLAAFWAFCTGLFFGRYTVESAKRLVFPLLLLAFIVPWDAQFQGATAALNSLTLWVTSVILKLASVSCAVSGQTLTVLTETFSLQGDMVVLRAAACTFVVLLALNAMFQRPPWNREWYVLLLALPLAVVAGIIRMLICALVNVNLGQGAAASIFYSSDAIVLIVLVVGFLILIPLLWSENHDYE